MTKPESAAPFADNWAYLKTELSWLDRLLMLAVARHRQDTKAINQVAKTTLDKATSHWWKGIVNFNQTPAYDDCRVPTAAAKSIPYAQQLEARIQATQQRGIMLGLPWLQQQFRLSSFEKKLILLVLAPEVNRRFGKLYRYLQQSDDYITDDLPTVDLCLRLLCRNDQEWRQARSQLVASNSLFEWGVLRWVDPPTMTLLSRRFRLVDEVTTYLLSEKPDSSQIEYLTPAAQAAASPVEPEPLIWVRQQQPDVPWKHLVLPAAAKEPLEILATAVEARDKSQLLLICGEPGTGKSTVAAALATRWGFPLHRIDLDALEAESTPGALGELASATGVILLETAQRWFGRQPTVDSAALRDWLQRSQAPLICLSSHYLQSITPSWRRRCTAVLSLPRPDVLSRRQILRQAVPDTITLDKRLRWIQLARQLPLTGGELTTLVNTAIAIAQQASEQPVGLGHFQRALRLLHPELSLKAKASQSSDDLP